MNSKWFGVYEDMSMTAGHECLYLIAMFSSMIDAKTWIEEKSSTSLFPLVLLQIDK